MKKSIHIILIATLLLFISQCTKEKQPIKALSSEDYPMLDERVTIPPAWAFGVLYGGYTNQQQTQDRIARIIEADYPIDAYWIDSWFWSFDDEGRGPDKYIDFVADTIAYPDRAAMWSFMQERGIKGGFWTWDAIQKTGNEEAFEDFERRGFFRDVYMNTNPWHNNSSSTAMGRDSGAEGTPTGNIDFDNPAVADYFMKRMKHFFDEGADFIKLDRTANIATLRTMFRMSQEYGLETKGRGFMLSHKFGIDDPEYKRYPIKWTSDTRADWTIENPLVRFADWVPNVAFKENIALFTDPDQKSSQIPFMTNDTGGFDKGSAEQPEEELYIRWVQFSAFNPVMAVFSQPENPTSNMAYNYSTRADEVFRRMTHLRMQLFPYIYSHALLARLENKSMIKPVTDQLYDYLFGDAFLVAPVYEKGATSRLVHFPEGYWYRFTDDEGVEGNQSLEVDAPTEELPLFVKAGSIIPMRTYARNIEGGTNDVLHLHLYTGADGSFTLYEDDGQSNDYKNLFLAKTHFEYKEENGMGVLKIHPTEGGFEGFNSQRTVYWHVHSQNGAEVFNLNESPLSFSSSEGSLNSEATQIDLNKENHLTLSLTNE